MSINPCYTVPQIAEMTGFSPQRIKRAITGQWLHNAKAKQRFGEPLPQLHAKRGSHNTYLVLHADLIDWLEKLPEAIEN